MIPIFDCFEAQSWRAKLIAGAILAALIGGTARAQEESYKPGAPTPSQKGKPAPLRQEGQSVFGGDRANEAGAWCIVIEAFRGEDQEAVAKSTLESVRLQGGLAEAYLDRRGEATVIAYGRYADPTSKQARADLDRVRGIEVVFAGEPRKVFQSAFLAPPADIRGTRPEYDLRNARKLNGDWAIYTLQVGVYSREDRKPASPADLAEFRKMAEQAVLKLRSEGEQAFYYHGPSRSMVTIGLWGVDDYDESATSGFKDKSPGLHALRQRFPNNLQNGMGIKQRLRLTDPKTGAQVVKEKLQPSNLVSVPKE